MVRFRFHRFPLGESSYTHYKCYYHYPIYVFVLGSSLCLFKWHFEKFMGVMFSALIWGLQKCTIQLCHLFWVIMASHYCLDSFQCIVIECSFSSWNVFGSKMVREHCFFLTLEFYRFAPRICSDHVFCRSQSKWQRFGFRWYINIKWITVKVAFVIGVTWISWGTEEDKILQLCLVRLSLIWFCLTVGATTQIYGSPYGNRHTGHDTSLWNYLQMGWYSLCSVKTTHGEFHKLCTELVHSMPPDVSNFTP